MSAPTGELRGSITAVQYDPTNTAALSALELPTGTVTFQTENPMTKAQARAYVPTAFGTHVLDPGDWVVLHESGYVFTLPDAAMSEVTTLGAPVVDELETQPIFRTDSFNTVDELSLSTVIDSYGLDWGLEVTPSNDAGRAYVLRVVATGLELDSWLMGDVVEVYHSGRVEVRVP